MLTTEATPEMVAEWKRIFEKHRAAMRPNRKSGRQVDAYFRSKYPCQAFDNPEFFKVVEGNIIENEFSRSKLPEGTLPDIKCYCTDGVLVGIDLLSGEIHVESEDMKKAVSVYDDLFAYRGLDENDLNNFFLVAEYITLTES